MLKPSAGCDLLVVGAGPVGLTMACEAIRHGLHCRIIDQTPEPSRLSKAQITHARTLEIFEDMGVVDAILKRGLPVHGANFFAERGHKRVGKLKIEEIDSSYSYFYSISQYDTECALIAHLEALGGRVERGVCLEDFTQNEAGIQATLVHADGATETLAVPWLAGCDGAHSTVRHILGTEFPGTKYGMHLIQADIGVDLPFPVTSTEAYIFIGAAGMIGFIPFKDPGRVRLMAFLREDQKMEPELENFQMLMRKFGPEGAVLYDPVWMVGFHIHCRQVEQYRHGRVFLAGDAGHVHSPAGGQGMNMEIQDAYNLAWKIALVQRGKVHISMLDSYHAERHPPAAEVLKWTNRATKGAAFNLGLRNPIALTLRNRLINFVTSLHIVRRRISQLSSMIEVSYPKSPIVAQDWGLTLRDLLVFPRGPVPGMRAPDAHTDPGDDNSPHLFEILHGTSHVLLLFEGNTPAKPVQEKLGRISERVQYRFGDLVVPYLVAGGCGGTRTNAGWSEPVFMDSAGIAHKLYAAHGTALYLVRPDGHIAYRSRPADGNKLIAYMESVFV